MLWQSTSSCDSRLVVLHLRELALPQSGAGDVGGEARDLKAPEDENARLKRLLADAMLDNAALALNEGPRGKEMVTPAAKGKAVARLKDVFGMSERRACKAIG